MSLSITTLTLTYTHTHPSQLISYPTKEKQELLTDDMKKKFSRCIFLLFAITKEKTANFIATCLGGRKKMKNIPRP